MKLFSAFGAASLLERDRQTVARALRHVAPDGREGKSPRWRLPTIIKALDASNRANNGGGGNGTTDNPPEYAAFDQAYDAVKRLPTLAKRRAAAVKTIPLLRAMMAALRQRGHDVGEDPDYTCLRSDRVFQLALIGFQGPCEWTHDQVWENLNTGSDADAA